VTKTRKQLTLFLDEKESDTIEYIRQKFNPQQYKLIKSHITLCKEDEIEAIDVILDNLIYLNTVPFTLKTIKIKQFPAGKGVMIPINDEDHYFKKLRESVLYGTTSDIRDHQPHITLMHPRNSTCSDAIFEELKKIPIPQKVTISSISLIEQEIGEEWKVIKVYDLTI